MSLFFLHDDSQYSMSLSPGGLQVTCTGNRALQAFLPTALDSLSSCLCTKLKFASLYFLADEFEADIAFFIEDSLGAYVGLDPVQPKTEARSPEC